MVGKYLADTNLISLPVCFFFFMYLDRSTSLVLDAESLALFLDHIRVHGCTYRICPSYDSKEFISVLENQFL